MKIRVSVLEGLTRSLSSWVEFQPMRTKQLSDKHSHRSLYTCHGIRYHGNQGVTCLLQFANMRDFECYQFSSDLRQYHQIIHGFFFRFVNIIPEISNLPFLVFFFIRVRNVASSSSHGKGFSRTDVVCVIRNLSLNGFCYHKFWPQFSFCESQQLSCVINVKA